MQWHWVDRPGLEVATIERDEKGTAARGNVLMILDGIPVRASYRVRHDPEWAFREAQIEVKARDARRQLAIQRQPDAGWQVNGEARADLEGCEDIDLMITPYTNTPPLARYRLAPGESRLLCVAWVRFPDLQVAAVRQEYTRLDKAQGPSRYRYRNLSSEFTSELAVDADGLVIAYGPWQRK